MNGMYSVIIIDDNKPAADALSKLALWKHFDCKVEAVCYDSFAGKKAILKVHPDIIVTDIKMPGLSGLDIIEMVRKEIPHAKVIFISAYDSFQYAQRALRLGAQDYLVKPFSQEAITQSIQNAVSLLAAEQQRNEPRGEDEKQPVQEAPLIHPIIDYMIEQIDRHITAEDVAKAFFMSTSRLDKLFQKYNGKGFRELRIELRMARAKELLMDVRNSMEDIAQKIGYKNYTSFYRAFTREYAISPTGYRDLMQNRK